MNKLIDLAKEWFTSKTQCFSDAECVNPITHYDNDGNAFCDFHWDFDL